MTNTAEERNAKALRYLDMCAMLRMEPSKIEIRAILDGTKTEDE